MLPAGHVLTIRVRLEGISCLLRVAIPIAVRSRCQILNDHGILSVQDHKSTAKCSQAGSENHAACSFHQVCSPESGRCDCPINSNILGCSPSVCSLSSTLKDSNALDNNA